MIRSISRSFSGFLNYVFASLAISLLIVVSISYFIFPLFINLSYGMRIVVLFISLIIQVICNNYVPRKLSSLMILHCRFIFALSVSLSVIVAPIIAYLGAAIVMQSAIITCCFSLGFLIYGIFFHKNTTFSLFLFYGLLCTSIILSLFYFICLFVCPSLLNGISIFRSIIMIILNGVYIAYNITKLKEMEEKINDVAQLTYYGLLGSRELLTSIYSIFLNVLQILLNRRDN